MIERDKIVPKLRAASQNAERRGFSGELYAAAADYLEAYTPDQLAVLEPRAFVLNLFQEERERVEAERLQHSETAIRLRAKQREHLEPIFQKLTNWCQGNDPTPERELIFALRAQLAAYMTIHHSLYDEVFILDKDKHSDLGRYVVYTLHRENHHQAHHFPTLTAARAFITARTMNDPPVVKPPQDRQEAPEKLKSRTAG